ncbi:release factor H-coupled RctB family protein [Peptoclostridium litorale DSM 5388]|uniref:3'-phosphate/5'-hydroxy nucleic acid ligase n=1 Tax=Peptoclostridium litorale DSM 5388 TaxID=1121324 RepID=A0A069RBS5_PEPLI|nr:RNA ligase RtcB family protein [Peptoclostridium litorale]KDR94213.1 release factor H-coupled RctB family protein [Peptoclostridium litorale DSM 5388]SIN82378.1 release factor H-coupled RctB family protein [Peptoclostridium litorale DSM 5388]
METTIKIVKREKSWIESSAIEQLESVAKLGGMVRAVGLPDIHVGKTPVGAAFVTKGIVYPHIIGNDVGCGMSLFSTGIARKKFKVSKVVKKLEKLQLDAMEPCCEIIPELEDIDEQFKRKLGTIGSGNHFAEFQEICEVHDNDELSKLGIKRGEVYLLVHSGSRSYGEHILRKHIEKNMGGKGLLQGIEGFNEYMDDHKRAVFFAMGNRMIVASSVCNHIGTSESRLILNSVHNGVSSYRDEFGEELFIHRKGAAPSDVGCIVVAGSRGSKSYIVKPSENLSDYAFSISHGAGRKWSRFSCKERLENVISKRAVRGGDVGSNIVCSDKKLIYEEAPQAYKDIERVIEDMLHENMITLVASLNPLVTYKG